ncbi:hypothetical protein GQ600_18303 [Phytophthora cactorum]|nr:hypothetical protein GQ600_18303 [Phytophthora cactorum]
MDAQRALLDSLMGLNRDGDRPDDDATMDFRHPRLRSAYEEQKSARTLATNASCPMNCRGCWPTWRRRLRAPSGDSPRTERTIRPGRRSCSSRRTCRTPRSGREGDQGRRPRPITAYDGEDGDTQA